MTAVKIVGALLLISAALLWAFMHYFAEKRRLNMLRFFSSLAFEIKRQIKMLDMPIERIIESIDMCGIDDVLKVHPEKIDISFLSALAERELYTEDARKAREFFSGLGRNFRDEEIQRCAYYSDFLSESLTKREEEYSAKCRMYFTVSLCMALGFIILII